MFFKAVMNSQITFAINFDCTQVELTNLLALLSL